MSQGLIDPSFVTVTAKKSKITSNCSFFPLPPPFFSSQSFFHHPLQVCDRFQTGWEGRTMCCDPQYRPPAQRLASTPSPSRPWGGLAAAPLPASRPPPLFTPPPPESIALRHHTNDPLKSMHHSTVHHQQWPAMWFTTEREGARIRWRVITGKYKIETEEKSENREKGKQKNKHCVHVKPEW